MRRDLAKTLSYLAVHLTVGFSVAYAFTGSIEIASGLAIIEPMINAVAFFFHEKLWTPGTPAKARVAGLTQALPPPNPAL
ncbi:MAG: membrane protein [Blastomonas sp. CACIA14H2]|jgi:uncharacterized membrane protein|uniref:DUF2061 domain-containing protein n=1 Tax=unclassified Blastomonas TaxID=2626550 RepID=UPI0003D03E75|nr:DUF2061 domain-containing protein [Blastomonas sp. UPD001]ESZ86211.1 MAG: membrane protein [Blastomonas sp. CACIA14H2]